MGSWPHFFTHGASLRARELCYYIHVIRPLTHLLTFVIVYVFLVCLCVYLNVFEAIWAGFAILSCVTKSVSYREFEMPWPVNLLSGMTSDHLTLSFLIGGSFESTRKKADSNLADNLSIHIVTHIVTCQKMNLFLRLGWCVSKNVLRLYPNSYQRHEKTWTEIGRDLTLTECNQSETIFCNNGY